MLAGGIDEASNQPARLVLMKIKLEYWEEDQAVLAARNQQVVDALTSGLVGAEKDVGGDARLRYVGNSRTSIPDMFKPKAPKRA